jgi:LacI family transcriptional regulator, galactose operon repressor
MLNRTTRAPRSKSGPRTGSSLKDVARLAGVSTATVSRAINAPAKLDGKTLARVQRAVSKLRYVPNGQARALRSQRSYTIGAVVPSFDYALYARTTSALETELEAHGYALLLGSHHYDLTSEVRVTRALIERGVDAFMFVGTDHDPELFVLLSECRRPYVLAWGLDRSGLHPSIGFHSQAATYALTEHLLVLGHRRFGLISAPHEGNDRARERSAGVSAALQGRGLTIAEGATQFATISLDDSMQAMERILALPHRPTAVLATNDVLAVGAMVACRQHGVRIPEELSITGVDNTDLGATQTPALTSVRTPIVEIGRATAVHLVAKLEGAPVQQCQELPFELVLRGSTAPPSTGLGRPA